MSKINKLLILIGPSASGKTTFCEQLLNSKNETWYRVSRDEYRYHWTAKGVVPEWMENLITVKTMEDIEYLLTKGNVVYDATNLTRRYIDMFVDKFCTQCPIEFIPFDISLDECLRRDKLRDRSVGEDVIQAQYKKFEELKKTFDFLPIKKQKVRHVPFILDPNKWNAMCFDIDGTLAHKVNRNAFDETYVLNDEPDFNTIFAVQSHKKAHGDDIHIIIVSGRTEGCRADTETWLQLNDIPYDKLFMRQVGDNRKDSIIKKEIYQEHIVPYYNIIGVYDDRTQVVRQLRSMGIKVFQVEPGNF